MDTEAEDESEGRLVEDAVTVHVDLADRELEPDTLAQTVAALLLDPVADPVPVRVKKGCRVVVADTVDVADARWLRVSVDIAVVVLEFVVVAVLVFVRIVVADCKRVADPVLEGRTVTLILPLAVPVLLGLGVVVCVTETLPDRLGCCERLIDGLEVAVFDSRRLRVGVADALGDFDGRALTLSVGVPVCVFVGAAEAEIVFETVIVRVDEVDPVVVLEAIREFDI